MKKFLLILLILLICCGGFMIVRTFLLTSRQVSFDPVEKVPISDSAIGHLAGAIQFRTISYLDQDADSAVFRDFHKYLEETFPLVHSQLEKQYISGLTLLYKWKGKDPSLEPVILMSHQDVVPVDQTTIDQWEADPFAGQVLDGKLIGRGSLDDKVGVMAILEAVEMHLSRNYQPGRTIYLSFGHDEELSGKQGALQVAEYFKKNNIHAALVLDEGGFIAEDQIPGIKKPVAMINVAEKGFASYRLTIKTKGGHSSRPTRDNAIGMLSKAIVDLENNQLPYRMNELYKAQIEYLGPELGFGKRFVFANSWLFGDRILEALYGRTTTAPTIFNSGFKDNVLPTEASAVVNFRIVPGETPESVEQHIREAIRNDQIKIEPVNDIRGPSPLTTSTEGAAYKVVERTIRELHPEAIIVPGIVMGGTDAKYFYSVSENVMRFFPLRINSSNITAVHGINEHIRTDNYPEVVRYFHRLIENLETLP